MKLGSAWSSPKEMAANCHAMTPTRESEAETQQDYDQKDCRCLAHDPKLAGTAMSVNTNKIAYHGGGDARVCRDACPYRSDDGRMPTGTAATALATDDN